MELTIAERTAIISVMPQAGNFTQVKLINDIVTECTVTAEELEAHGTPAPGQPGQYNISPNYARDIELTPLRTQLIVSQLRALNEAGGLTLQHFSIYDKFVEQPAREAEAADRAALAADANAEPATLPE